MLKELCCFWAIVHLLLIITIITLNANNETESRCEILSQRNQSRDLLYVTIPFTLIGKTVKNNYHQIVAIGRGNESNPHDPNDEISQTKTSLPPPPGRVPGRRAPVGHRAPDTHARNKAKFTEEGGSAAGDSSRTVALYLRREPRRRLLTGTPLSGGDAHTGKSVVCFIRCFLSQRPERR